MEREEGVVVRGRVEIDTRRPFRSVKEAVVLFGEKVLAGEIYAKQLKTEKTSGVQKQTKFEAMTAELEETKRNLEKAKEEESFMAEYLQSLREELEQTKREIQQLKVRDTLQKQIVNPETEELKFVENAQPKANKVEVKTQTGEEDEEEEIAGFHRKRSVKFASPPLLTRVFVSKDDRVEEETTTSNAPSQLKKKLKRKPLIPLIGALFSKKGGNGQKN